MSTDLLLNNRSLSTRYKSSTANGLAYPLAMKSSHGSTIIDIEGRKYLDLSAGYGVVNVGWQRAELIKTIQEQAEKSCFVSPWMSSEESTELAEKLLSLSPKSISKVMRAAGGGEAVENALKVFRSQYPDGEILSFNHAYHGGTSATLALGDHERFNFPQGMSHLNVHKINPPYSFRYYSGGLDEFSDTLEKKLKDNAKIKAIIFEPILGSGGIITPPMEFYILIREICHRHNLIMIVDEVLTGFGRTGSLLASNEFDLMPDIICLAKGLSSGYMPIGATLLSPELAITMESNFDDVTSTFSWTPLAAKVASKNIDLILSEDLAEKSKESGEYFKRQLSAIFYRYLPGNVGEIRGRGLFIGIELVNDLKTKAPAEYLAKKIVLKCKSAGLIMTASWDHHILTIHPPLIITKDELDMALHILESTLRQISRPKIFSH